MPCKLPDGFQGQPHVGCITKVQSGVTKVWVTTNIILYPLSAASGNVQIVGYICKSTHPNGLARGKLNFSLHFHSKWNKVAVIRVTFFIFNLESLFLPLLPNFLCYLLIKLMLQTLWETCNFSMFTEFLICCLKCCIISFFPLCICCISAYLFLFKYIFRLLFKVQYFDWEPPEFVIRWAAI